MLTAELILRALLMLAPLCCCLLVAAGAQDPGGVDFPLRLLLATPSFTVKAPVNTPARCCSAAFPLLEAGLHQTLSVQLSLKVRTPGPCCLTTIVLQLVLPGGPASSCVSDASVGSQAPQWARRAGGMCQGSH